MSTSVELPELRIEKRLRPWQESAAKAWTAAGCRGVIEAATGTGKTLLALACAAQLHRAHTALRIAIVVPTNELISQWRSVLEGDLGIPRKYIGEQHHLAQVEWSGHPILLTVVNTAREALPRVLTAWTDRPTFIIVDECHRIASARNIEALRQPSTYTLGISATPERDDERHLDVYRHIGPVVFRYPLLKALDEEVLAELTSIVLYVQLTAGEAAVYADLTESIGRGLMTLSARHAWASMPTAGSMDIIADLAKSDPAAASVLMSINDRRKLVAECARRQECAQSILTHLSQLDAKKIIAFHDTIDGAERVAESGRRAGLQTVVAHSRQRPDEQRRAIAAFRGGDAQLLSTVRLLDEGFDVPEADSSIIVSGSKVRRQRIQRLGRVLRRTETSDTATVFTILADRTAEALVVGGRERALVGAKRARHHQWPAVDVAVATLTPSTVEPASLPQVPNGADLLDLLGQGFGPELRIAYPWLQVARTLQEAETFSRRLAVDGPERDLSEALESLQQEDWPAVTNSINTAVICLGRMGVRTDSYITPEAVFQNPEVEALERCQRSLRIGLQQSLRQLFRGSKVEALRALRVEAWGVIGTPV